MTIREKDLNSLLSIFQNSLSKPYKVLAFGSRVNGEAHDTSDLDLVVVKDGKIEIGEFIKLKENIKFSNIPILDWNRIPKSFQENIEKKFEVLITEI